MSFLTRTKSASPAAPASGKATSYVDQNGVENVIDDGGTNIAVSGRGWFNWLGNAGFWFAQRQTPATPTTYSSTAGRAFTADRWAVTNENASAQFARTDTVSAAETGLQARYYGNFTKITSNGKLAISQALLGDDAANLRGRTVRVQFNLKSIVAASATWRVGLIQLTSAGTVDTIPATFISAFNAASTDPTLGANLSYIAPKSGSTADNATITGNAISCTVTTSWQRFGALFDVPTNCKNLIVMVWSDAQVTTTNGIAMSQATLVDGYEIQVWKPEDLEEEYQRVSRFIVKTFANDTAPAQNLGVNTGNLDSIAGKAGATALGAQIPWRFPERLWTATPTVTLYNPAAANAQVRDVGAGVDCSAAASVVTTTNLRVTATGNAGTAVGNQVSIHAFVDAEF
jgi:hypothetical protein